MTSWTKHIKEIRASLTQSDQLHSQRELILFNMLIGVSILGFFLLGAYVPLVGIPQERWGAVIIFSLIYAWVLAVTLNRRFPYLVRAVSLVAIIYILGLVTILQDGLQGNARLYLLSFSVISGILMGVNGGMVATGLSLATILGSGFLIRFGLIKPEILDTNNLVQTAGFWAVAVIAFITCAATTTISIVTLVQSLERSLKGAQDLTGELEKERASLEINVRNRTSDLERRLVQIRTAAQITNAINTILEPKILIQQVVDLIRDRFNLYYVGIFLLDEREEYAVLQAGTGESGRKMVEEGHRLLVGGESMIGWAVSNRKARIALDVGIEAVRFDNPHLPHTRSELALPLIAGERVLGAMTVQSDRPEAFDQDDITVLQGTADSLVTALENARLFQEVGERLSDIRTLHQQYLSRAWGDTLQRTGMLAYTFESDQTGKTGEQPAGIEAPLTLRDLPIGRIVLEGGRTAWTPEEIAFLEAVSTEAAVALENARLFEETQHRAERERVMASVSAKVRAHTNVEAVLKTALQEVGQVLGASRGTIVLHSDLENMVPGDGHGNPGS